MRSDTRVDTTFGNRLVEEGIVNRRSLEEAMSRSQKSGRPLIEHLCQDSALAPDVLYPVLSRQLDIPYRMLKTAEIPTELIRRIPIKVVTHYQFAPLKLDGGRLLVACHYPMNLKTLDEVKLQTGCAIDQILSSREDIQDLIRRAYGMAAGTVDRIVAGSYRHETRDDVEVSNIALADQLAGDASVINLVNEVILEAYKKRATDIHLEPYRGQFRLRYRIDGMLHDANLSTKARSLILPIISRIKIMSNLDIVEHRLPQDGRAIVKIGEEKLDLRVSSIPTPYGESIVIRVLKTDLTFDLGLLGLTSQNIEIVNDLINRPHGLLLLTGPTGSGKTTTLYTCLNQIRSDSLKIISLEDPIEYDIQGITQIQVQPKVGLTFASGLRSMLRHDPDIMMVGEIRDLETAEIAIRAALTGHLIFSTLHTNDAASGFNRLVDIGVEPFLIASSVQAMIAQRLIRVICTRCKEENAFEPASIKERIRKDMGLGPSEPVRTYVGRGCSECNHTGFYGRTALHEILTVTEPIRELILNRASAQEIKNRAITDGMLTLLQDGWGKVLNGTSTTGEVINVASLGTV
jgi:type II secretory ATPase GspE/PulE/Tfp pilus assembly ATPase PilB-like protein